MATFACDVFYFQQTKVKLKLPWTIIGRLTVFLTAVVISDMYLQVSVPLELFETKPTSCAGREVNVVTAVVVVGPFVGLQVR